MIEEPTPLPPPTADLGPDAATLHITVKDQETGEPVSATVTVNQGHQEPEDNPYRPFSLRQAANRHKGPIRFRKLDYYFFTDGSFSVKVPPGKCTVEVRKGYEYSPAQRVFHLNRREEVAADIYLSRWINMAREGWYSGDTHIHFERTGQNDEILLTLTSARDVRYAFILSMNIYPHELSRGGQAQARKPRGYDQGREFEAWRQAPGLGAGSTYQRGPYSLSSGQEYRVASLGHVTIVLADDYVRAAGRTEDVNRGPSLGVIADQAHESRGFIGLNHGGYHRQEADALALTGKMDFLELLQFGGYRGLGLQGWYDFLNIGYRWPIVAGSDFPYTKELSDNVTYVYSEKTPTVREFMQQAARGASFVTSGPMLFLTVNGKRPGEFITFEEPKIALKVKVRVVTPLYPVRYVDLIQNGRVISRKFDPSGRSMWTFTERQMASESGWVAVRAYADAGTESHTNPIYIYKRGERPFDDEACGHILARLEGSIRTISNPAIRQRLQEIKRRLAVYRDKRDAEGLALPPAVTGY